MTPKEKFFLFKQSKRFCAAPWSNLCLNPDGNVRTCCVGGTDLGNIKKQTIEEILSGDKLKEIKTTLINDQHHDNCKSCVSRENATPWLRGFYNDLAKYADINYYNLDSFLLTGLDIRWSNSCNFMCVYCVPKLSSSIANELGIKIKSDDVGKEKLMAWALHNQHTLKEVYLAGGEPLLMKENQEFLKNLDKNVKLRINTNLSNLDDRNPLFNLIKQFKNVEWIISVDNTHDRYEYTRYGSNWENFVRYCQDLASNNQYEFIFNVVYFVGNATTLDQDITVLSELIPQAKFSVNPVFHECLTSSNLPEHLKPIAKQNLKLLIEKDLKINERDLLSCVSELEKLSTDQQYQTFFDQIDKRRGTNWKKTFCELA
jgi:radical SAM protein with 4Fe4S-binding SPASM domain